MRCAGILAVFMGLMACTTSGDSMSSNRRWCSLRYIGSPSDWIELPQAHVSGVAIDKLDLAVSRLRHVSILPLTSEQASSLSGHPSQSNRGSYYLIRSGIFAMPSASPRQYHEFAEATHKIVAWNPNSRHLMIHIFQLWEGERQLFDIPLIVQVDVNPVESYSVCQSLH